MVLDLQLKLKWIDPRFVQMTVVETVNVLVENAFVKLVSLVQIVPEQQTFAKN
jgi:hypothetical protein